MLPNTQLDLFSETLHAYTKERGGVLDNATLYADVARRAGIPPEALSERVPVGESRQPHNLLERLGRRWLTTECMLEYVLVAASRFADARGFRQHLLAA